MGKLERELDVRLFNRTTRSVSLTYAGRIFIAQIKPALEGVQKAMNTARSQQETPSGVLHINAFATAAREIMAPLVLSYLKLYPQVHIDIVTEGQLVDVVAAGFDLGVRSADLVPSDAIAIPLGKMRRMAVAVSPASFENRDIPQVPQDLISYPCVRGQHSRRLDAAAGAAVPLLFQSAQFLRRLPGIYCARAQLRGRTARTAQACWCVSAAFVMCG